MVRPFVFANSEGGSVTSAAYSSYNAALPGHLPKTTLFLERPNPLGTASSAHGGGLVDLPRGRRNPNHAAWAAWSGEWKRGCQPAILNRVDYAACSFCLRDLRLTSVRRREASKLAWTGLIR